MSEAALKSVTRGSAQVVSGRWSPDQRVRTVLFCKNAFASIGLKHLLADTGFAVSGVASDAASLSVCCSRTPPDLFLVDGSTSPGQVLETVRILREQCPEARVVIIADDFDFGLVWQGHDAGVDGFCRPATGREVLIKSLELVMLGEAILPSTLARAMLAEKPQHPGQAQDVSMAEPEPVDPKAGKLSAREADILKCLMAGEPNKVIARKLDVAEATVKVHVKAILRKIQVANRTQAAMWATRHLPMRGGSCLSATPNEHDG